VIRAGALAVAVCASAAVVLAHIAPVLPVRAQTLSLRVARDSDGNLYMLGGDTVWLLVPDEIGDEELGGYTFAGRLDGTVPPALLLPLAPPSAPPSEVPLPVKASSIAPGTNAEASPTPSLSQSTPLRRGGTQPTPVVSVSPTAATTPRPAITR
jgi:hypothetical protein